MPSKKVVLAPITTTMLADGCVTTAKLADGSVTTAKIADANVTAAKLATGIISSRITFDHTSASYTLAAGAESSIISISGNGHADILFAGDGDGVFNMRVYIDGTLEEGFPTNESRVGTYSFTSSIEVRIYNPTTASATQKSSSFNLRGVSR